MTDRVITFRTLDERTEPAQYVNATLRTIGPYAALFIGGQIINRGVVTFDGGSIVWCATPDLDRQRAVQDHAIDAWKSAVRSDV